MPPALALENHPLADLVPVMDEDQYDRLRSDIREHGLLDPIMLFEGMILDGRHRYRACMETGVEPHFKEYGGDSPAQFVLSHNLARRHLTTSQRAMVATDFLPHLAYEAKLRQGGSTRFGSRAETREPGAWEERDPSHEGVAGIAGKTAGVSGSHVRKAKKVAEERPDLGEKVLMGEMTVEAAYREATGKDRRPEKKTPLPKSASEMTDRQKQKAEASKQRIQKAVTACNAMSMGLDDVRVEEAVLVTSLDEIEAWVASINKGKSALTRLHNRLKGALK